MRGLDIVTADTLAHDDRLGEGARLDVFARAGLAAKSGFEPSYPEGERHASELS